MYAYIPKGGTPVVLGEIVPPPNAPAVPAVMVHITNSKSEAERWARLLAEGRVPEGERPS
jgi:hypothetical protein